MGRELGTFVQQLSLRCRAYKKRSGGPFLSVRGHVGWGKYGYGNNAYKKETEEILKESFLALTKTLDML